MISGLAKSEVKPREELFVTTLPFSDERVEPSIVEPTEVKLASYDRKRVKKNRTTE